MLLRAGHPKRAIAQLDQVPRGEVAYVEAERLNLIDVTPVGTNQISGHMYHVFNPGVIEDLRHLLGTEDAGTKRTYRRVPSEQPGFWTLEPARD